MSSFTCPHCGKSVSSIAPKRDQSSQRMSSNILKRVFFILVGLLGITFTAIFHLNAQPFVSLILWVTSLTALIWGLLPNSLIKTE